MQLRALSHPLSLVAACAIVSACGDSGGNSTPVAEGNDLRFVLSWDGPADMDLVVITPNGRRISFVNESGDGCVLSGDAGGSSGRLEEEIVCTNLTPGEYEALVFNNEDSSVPVLLEAASGGASIASRDITLRGLSEGGRLVVRVPGEEPGPVPGDIAGVWRESNGRLRSSTCQDEIDDLFEDLLVGAGGALIIETEGSQVSITDADDTATLVGSIDGTDIDVDTTLSESGGGCSAEAQINVSGDLGRSPTTVTYRINWGFRGCPGFSSCRQTLEARWAR